MSRQNFYIIHGMGNDTVGLVGNITTPIAAKGGNIVDLRQDVLHGLFTIYLVVDLADSELRFESLKEMINTIAEDTGLRLSVEHYHPVARNPEKKNILIILIGGDKPGIIASISQTLGNYKANIESAQNIGREGLFLMELLTDVSHCTLPMDNLKKVIKQKMDEKGITVIFQTEDVFNKKKRVILFDINHCLIPVDTQAEILKQSGLTSEDLNSAYPTGDPVIVLSKAAKLLEGLSADVINTIAKGIYVEAGTMELLQTLKIMGYKIGVVSNGFSVFAEVLARKLGLDYSYGVGLRIDDDSRTVSGLIAAEEVINRSINVLQEQIAQKEYIEKDDVTVVSDKNLPIMPGLRIEISLEMILDMVNKHVISKDNLIGLLGSFGIPRT
jgi:phosphoserine phosphatase